MGFDQRVRAGQGEGTVVKLSRASTDWLLLAGFCGFLFFFGLAYFGLIGADEPRYAQVAREMLARHDWITPTLGGKPWLEKPPLYYWQAILAYSIFGVSDWAARLPSAVDATLMVVAIYLFLKRFRPGFELDGALMTAAAAGVIGFARAASTDMPLSAMFTIALLAWYAWYESSLRRYLAGFYCFFVFRHANQGTRGAVVGCGDCRDLRRGKEGFGLASENALDSRDSVVSRGVASLAHRRTVEESGILPHLRSST